jgi:YD repeat-containing protein
MNAVTWQYERDEVGRLTAIADPLGRRRRFTYDEQGRLAGVAKAWQGAPQVELEYDGNGRVVRESVDGAVLRHTYDDAGRLSETGVEAPGRQPRSLGFEWDASGTLTRLRGEPVVLDAGGRAVSVGGRMRRWDAGGAMVAREAGGRRWTLAHDGHGRLASASRDGHEVAWEVDGQGRLLARRGQAGQRHLHWFRGALLAARGAGPEVLHVPGEAAGERVGVVTDREARYFIQRPDGTIVAALRGDGTVAAAALFDPFGEAVHTEGEGAGEDWYPGAIGIRRWGSSTMRSAGTTPTLASSRLPTRRQETSWPQRRSRVSAIWKATR